jgi:prefoldin subunit 5
MIREFSNVKDLIGYIDSKLMDLRKEFGEVIRYVEELRRKTEAQKKISSILTKLGAEARLVTQAVEIDLKSVKIAFNPSAEYELRYYERYIEDLNQKINKLASMRKDLDAVSTELSELPARIIVMLKDDIPDLIILKL